MGRFCFISMALIACSTGNNIGAAIFSVASFQISPIINNRKTSGAASFSPINSLLRASNEDEDSSDPTDRTKTSESLRHAIANLVSIIDEPINSPSSATDQSSIVHIIGTGLTPTLLNLPLSTLHILSKADVVLHDSLGLSYEDICQIVPKNCEVICVGKRGDKKSWKQKDIDDLILQMAITSDPSLSSTEDDNNNTTQQQQQSSKRKNIVRLKGGDPFLFGRTKTEIETLRSNEIPYTYTPGISSCIAGPHLGGIPLTDPSLDCQSFGVWSGTDAFGKSWGLNKDDNNEGKEGKEFKGVGVDVLVFLMIGRLDKLEGLCKSIANGGESADGDTTKWSKDTPCAVIQNAGGIHEVVAGDSKSPVQRVWRSTLENIVGDIKEEDSTRTSVSPAVFIVGATAALDLLSQDY